MFRDLQAIAASVSIVLTQIPRDLDEDSSDCNADIDKIEISKHLRELVESNERLNEHHRKFIFDICPDQAELTSQGATKKCRLFLM